MQGRPAGDFPAATFPTVFADGVASYAHGPGFVKFYLYRIDPNMYGRGGAISNPFAQVVMPVVGFAQAVVLFKRALSDLIRAGQISQSDVDKMETDLAALNRPQEPTRS